MFYFKISSISGLVVICNLVITCLGQCPGGEWKSFNGRCFLIKVGGQADFLKHGEADLACRMLNNGQGRLLTIHSPEENDFVYQEAMKIMNGNQKMHMWLGMTKEGKAGYPYTWQDDSLVNYVNWEEGEPNDIDGSQNCVRMYEWNGRWDDFDCNSAGTEDMHGYVCQDRPVTRAESSEILPPIASEDGCCGTGDVFAILFGIVIAIELVAVVFGYLYFYKWDKKLPWQAGGPGTTGSPT